VFLKRLNENLLYVAQRHTLNILVSNNINYPADFDETAPLNSDSTDLEEIESETTQMPILMRTI